MMNYPSAVYCFLYQGRIDEGQPVSGSPTTGNIVLSLCFAMIIFGIFISLVILPGFGDELEKTFQDIFGKNSGQIIGRLLLLLLLALIFPIVRRVYGSQSAYDEAISLYKKLPPNKKKIVLRKGKLFFLASIAAILIPLMLLLVKTGI